MTFNSFNMEAFAPLISKFVVAIILFIIASVVRFASWLCKQHIDAEVVGVTTLFDREIVPILRYTLEDGTVVNKPHYLGASLIHKYQEGEVIHLFYCRQFTNIYKLSFGRPYSYIYITLYVISTLILVGALVNVATTVKSSFDNFDEQISGITSFNTDDYNFDS